MAASMFAGRLLDLCDYVQSWGELGPVIYIGVLAAAIVCCLPCTIFEIIPGFLFGVKMGFATSIIGKNLGNLICVVLAKTVLADWVHRSVLPKLSNGRVLERMIKNQGFAAICVFRGVVYAPLPVKNYGLGALDIPAHHIVLAAVLTGAPYCLWWAYLGSKAKNVADIVEGRSTESLFTMPSNPMAAAAVALAAVAFLAFVLVRGKAAWRQAKDEIQAERLKEAKN
mmetsp:Transcript_13316/g.34041  ORF Transcript_13316/g.34041 Transcript_13316/m.34041 type:complete len:226 (-) Transcript_13316:123-800(-)